MQVDVVLALGDSITAAFGAAGRRGGLVSALENVQSFSGWSVSLRCFSVVMVATWRADTSKCSFVLQKEFRGWSWSIGGDENVTTLPNFIRNYNPALTGYSVGHREGSLCWSGICRGDGIHRPKHDVMNAALSGAMMQ